jgi:predicted SprT family Zn-dependent metalloprotease
MLIEQSFKELFPEKEFKYISKLRYTGKIKGYNGNISLRLNNLTVNLSREWEDISDDIKKGLIQLLMNKLFKTKVITYNIDLYNIFLKKVHITIKKNEQDPILKQSFERINNEYLNGSIEIPNLKWGSRSYRKLGSYDYGKDIIVISTILKEAPIELLDYVMYHEALHKKVKFTHNISRSHYHTKEFKDLEKKFKNFDLIIKQLDNFLRKKKFKSFFGF